MGELTYNNTIANKLREEATTKNTTNNTTTTNDTTTTTTTGTDTTNDTTTTTTKGRRKRRITYFNPPFSLLLATNIPREVKKIIQECFPKGSKIAKTINKNTIQTSYCTTANLGAIIKQHNNKLLQEPAKQEEKCTCTKVKCPLGGMCGKSSVIYQATVHCGDQTNIETGAEGIKTGTTKKPKKWVPRKTEKYIGMTGGKFKDRWNFHNSQFRHRHLSTTSISNYIWELKDHGYNNYSIKCKYILYSHKNMQFMQQGEILLIV